MAGACVLTQLVQKYLKDPKFNHVFMFTCGLTKHHLHLVPWIILLGFLVIAYKVLRVKIIIAVGIISSPVSLFLFTILLTVECYGPYTAKDGECKFNGTVTSQCPSGSGVLKAYHSKDAYALGQNVSTTLLNYIPVILYFLFLCVFI